MLFGISFEFSRQKETRISTWADTKDRLVNPQLGLKAQCLSSIPVLEDRRTRGDFSPTLSWEGGK